MMEFMSDWMRGLILVIFLAVFLDMLLPNSKMQGYVKVVMGLLVILMMMNPVLALFGTSVYEIDLSVDRLLDQNKGESALPALDAIQAQGKQLQEASQTQIVDQWKAAITDAVRSSVEQDYPVKVSSVEVGLTVTDQGQPEALTGLTVTVGPKDSAQTKPIQEIEPVIIGGAQEPEPVSKRAPVPAAAKEHVAAIKAQLAAEYQLTGAKVDVIWQES